MVVTYRDGIPIRRRSPIAVLTGPDVHIMTQRRKTRTLAGVLAVSKLTVGTIAYRRRRPCQTPHCRRPTTWPTRCHRHRRGRARRWRAPAIRRRAVSGGAAGDRHPPSDDRPTWAMRTHCTPTTTDDETRDMPALTRRYSL